jgi:hypothetical protein
MPAGKFSITTEDLPDGQCKIVKMTFAHDDGSIKVVEGDALMAAIEDAWRAGFITEEQVKQQRELR